MKNDIDKNINIGKRIKERREELKMTQEELGKNLWLNKSTIQRYESGKIERIKLPIIHAMAKQLDVDPNWLILKTDDKGEFKERFAEFTDTNSVNSNLDIVNIDETLQHFETASYSKNDRMQIVFVFSPNTPEPVRKAIKERFIKMRTTDELSADELELLDSYRKLNDDGKRHISETAETAMMMKKYKNEADE